MSCNKTFEEINKTHGTIIKSGGAYFGLIDEKSIKEDIADKDLYAIKVLNDNRISNAKAYFITSNEEKTKISKLAEEHGYTFEVLCPEDYAPEETF